MWSLDYVVKVTEWSRSLFSYVVKLTDAAHGHPLARCGKDSEDMCPLSVQLSVQYVAQRTPDACQTIRSLVATFGNALPTGPLSRSDSMLPEEQPVISTVRLTSSISPAAQCRVIRSATSNLSRKINDCLLLRSERIVYRRQKC